VELYCHCLVYSEQVLLALARIFVVGVKENGSMILLFVNKSEVYALPDMMLLNLGFIM